MTTNTEQLTERVPSLPFATFILKAGDPDRYAALLAADLRDDTYTLAATIEGIAAELLEARPSGRYGWVAVTPAELRQYHAHNRAERANALAAFRAKYGHDVPTIRY